MDKLTAMQTFIKVADAGSFSQAARLMNAPKTRVSQRVSELEKELGIRLLERNTRSLKLTPAGEKYLSRCREITGAIDQAEHEMRGEVYGARGHIRVDMLSPIARWVIAPRLHQFMALHPEITLSIISNDSFASLYEDNVDCAIRGGELKDSGMISRHLCNVELALYASPEYAATLGENPKLLSDRDIITWLSVDEHNLVWSLTRGNETLTLRSEAHLYMNDHDAALRHCAAGKGICPGIGAGVSELISAGRLVRVFPGWALAPRPVSIVYPSRKHLPQRVRLFVDWVCRTFSAAEVEINSVNKTMTRDET
ncbi:LysR family transcriptional regulator [Serratia quinivorans]|uniref:LysR family transcriptional regulator n=1 Tax=Serratia quinivorans TaxID=137545 RepID=UPI0021771476|nr:LysR family transcriptional regulator [Serratia quinivorans]CAI1959285.1 D-malate degradation protein R [Serratia quinivorans]CAI2160688.1 D-malate degradation protein R [Serratia quinivorans]